MDDDFDDEWLKEGKKIERVVDDWCIQFILNQWKGSMERFDGNAPQNSCPLDTCLVLTPKTSQFYLSDEIESSGITDWLFIIIIFYFLCMLLYMILLL